MSGYGSNFRNKQVDVHQFAMIPSAEIPRSSFRMQNQHKTTFGASDLIPVYVQEVLPGDSFNVKMTAYVRLATPLFPIMDNMELESFFFFVPNRLVWTHWVNFMGEQTNPADSISFNIPQTVSPVGGWPVNSIWDYMGLPTVGQVGGANQVSVNVLPMRAYNLIWNQWFRDENLQNSIPNDNNDGPDPFTDYGLQKTNRRHDYFTSCLPWTQKGGVAITLPLGSTAIVKTSASAGFTGVQPASQWLQSTTGTVSSNNTLVNSAGNIRTSVTAQASSTETGLYPTNLYADLSTATAATINQIRLAFQTQRLLERDARGGTRYTEIVRSHFRVVSPDMRLQRPEYLGGGKSSVNIAPVPQTSGTGGSGTTTPLGNLAAVGTAVAQHGFRYSSTEHGYIIGLTTVRSTQAYQQGLRKMWSRSTRYDFYWPVFAMLGEQAVLNKEIFSDGSANDALTFGYQERWAEYRYHPSYTTGYFRSTSSGTLDAWHLGIKYAALPTLNTTFVTDATASTLVRNLAAGAAANSQQFYADLFFDERVARPLPMYSVPGLIDHF